MSCVLTCGQLPTGALEHLLQPYHLQTQYLASSAPIPGSYWGAPEAGLVGHCLLIRDDTPVHSALHEACHYICMDETRRDQLHTDAGGTDLEESAVCYLQIVLADALPTVGRTQLMRDMDQWGYSFRLGSTQAWFEHDANDAHAWLYQYGLIDAQQQPTGQLRRQV